MKNLSQKCSAVLLALASVGLFTLPSNPAQAQSQHAHAAPRIDGFNVDEVARLEPGVELEFTLWGTPGGNATLRLAGAQHTLALIEIGSGQYEGTYTISRRDRLSARSMVTANLRVGNRVETAVLNESLQIGVGPHNNQTNQTNQTNQAASAPLPRIENFTVRPASSLSPGNELQFSLRGTPGARVAVAIAGGRGKFFLPEVSPGEYSTVYTIRNADRLAPDSVVTANMEVDQRVSTQILRQSLLNATAPVVLRCPSCGVVEAVHVVEVKGEGGYLGVIGGGLAGALLGSQIGGGQGRTAAELAGAVGGAYAGKAIEGNVNKRQHYEVVVRLENGATQTVEFAAESGYRVGDKVSISNGTLRHL